jgi:hypothetical protein
MERTMTSIERAIAAAAALAWVGAPVALAHGLAPAAPPASHEAERGYLQHMAHVGHDAQHSVAFIGDGFRGAAFIGRTNGTTPPDAVSGTVLARLALAPDAQD